MNTTSRRIAVTLALLALGALGGRAALAGGISVTSASGQAITASSSAGHTMYSSCTGLLSYAGYFVSENYRALYAWSINNWYDAYFPGIGGIYVAGGVHSREASRTLVLNGGDEPLDPGDIVAIAGVAPDPFGHGPILAVTKATATHHPAVVGVAVQAVAVTAQSIDGRILPDLQPVEGPAPPGGMLAIVTSGLVAAVKVDAAAEPWRVGDWVAASAIPGLGRRHRRQPAAAPPPAPPGQAQPTPAAPRPRKGASLVPPGHANPALTTEGATEPEVGSATWVAPAPEEPPPLLGMAAGPYDPLTGTVPVFVLLR